MRFLAFLTGATAAVMSPDPGLTALTVLSLAVVWLAWPVADLIEELIG